MSIPDRKKSEQRFESGSRETIFCRSRILVFAGKKSGGRKGRKRLVLS